MGVTIKPPKQGAIDNRMDSAVKEMAQMAATLRGGPQDKHLGQGEGNAPSGSEKPQEAKSRGQEVTKWEFPNIKDSGLMFSYASIADIMRADREFANWVASVVSALLAIDLPNLTFGSVPMPQVFIDRHGGDGVLYFDKHSGTVKLSA